MPLNESKLKKICDRVKRDREEKLQLKRDETEKLTGRRRDREELLDLMRIEGEL